MSKIVVVVPTIRSECHAQFVKAWTPLFEKHKVIFVTVWDGDDPKLTLKYYGEDAPPGVLRNRLSNFSSRSQELICRHTDAVRNVGFIVAAELDPTHILTLDDDCYPLTTRPNNEPSRGEYLNDPIQSHLDALDRRVPLSWMNTAHDTDLYLRGVPYGVRTEAPVMLSHGVWVGTPDFDGETQLLLEQSRVGIPHSLPYYVGPIPRGVLAAICGMNVMVKRDALPYLYYAPMGKDSGVPDLHRFADIFMGVFLKREFDRLGWACVTGYSTIHHTRASDAKKNFEQEKLGREWMEYHMLGGSKTAEYYPTGLTPYSTSYADKRRRYADLITSLLEKK